MKKIDPDLLCHVAIQYLAHIDALDNWLNVKHLREDTVLKQVTRHEPIHIFSFLASKEGYDYWANINQAFKKLIRIYEKKAD